MGSRWSHSGRAARWGHDRQRSHRARWATTSRAYAGRRRWTRLVGAHIDSAPPRLDSDSQAAVDVFYCDVVSVNAVLAELRSPCSKNEKNPLQKPQLPSLCPLLLQPQFVLRRRVNSLHSWNSSLDAIASERVHQYDQCASFAAVQLFAVSSVISYARGHCSSFGLSNADPLHCYAARCRCVTLAPISVRDASRGRHDSQKHLQRPRTHASVDAGSMPPKKRGGTQRPPGMMAPKTKEDTDRSIKKQREAIEDEYGGPTPLLPREHEDFFTSVDATNVHLNDERLTSLSLKDANNICPGDGGRGTNRSAVRDCLPDRRARHAQQTGADATGVERAAKRARGVFDLELQGLGRAEREAAWRKLLVIPGSKELAVGCSEFVKRAGGSGSHFWKDLSRERAAAMADEARGRGELWASDRERTHTAS